MVPRYPGYVSVVSRRYNELHTLAFEATTERAKEVPPAYAGPLVENPTYPTPKKVLSRPTGNNVSKDSPIRDGKVVPCVEPLPLLVNTIEEKGGSARAPGRPMKDVATNKDKDDRMTDRMTRSTIYKWITDLQVSFPWVIRFTNARRTMEQGISRRKSPDLHQV